MKSIILTFLLLAQTAFTQSQTSTLATIQEMQQSFRTVAQKVLPTVVEVNVIAVIRQNIPRTLSPFDFFFNPSPGEDQFQEREYRQPGLGSGVIVHRDGNRVYVLTNNHVIGNADEISIRLYDEREFEAKIVGKDERLDLALVEFTTREDVEIAELGDSDALFVGDWVLAIGNPYGFESTVTAGIISALGRRVNPEMAIAGFTEYIQTDAAINQGNSGGALVNIHGEIIGINTWIASQSGGSVGLGFAIPVNTAKRAIHDFLQKGRIVYGWLGVGIADLYEIPGSAEDLKLGSETGSLIINVYKDSPAHRDGMMPGDFVVSVNNTPIRNKTDFSVAIGNIAPGERALLTLLRNAKQQRISVTLDERDSDESTHSNSNLWPGFVGVKITDEVRASLQLPGSAEGVILAYIAADSPAAKAGLQQGDIVKEVNGKRVPSLSDLYGAVNSAGGRTIEFETIREGRTVRLRLQK